jgi:hypothetical protein
MIWTLNPATLCSHWYHLNPPGLSTDYLTSSSTSMLAAPPEKEMSTALKKSAASGNTYLITNNVNSAQFARPWNWWSTYLSTAEHPPNVWSGTLQETSGHKSPGLIYPLESSLEAAPSHLPTETTKRHVTNKEAGPRVPGGEAHTTSFRSCCLKLPTSSGSCDMKERVIQDDNHQHLPREIQTRRL